MTPPPVTPPGAEPPRFRVVTDDDGHWYLIPAERRDEFDEWLNSEAAMDGEELPWAERLNMHPSNHTFADWREDR